MLGKLGDLLNRDVGALVKDAGKVLNTDVGTIAKGAGKVLNTDVGTLAKGAGKVLNTDLGAMLRDTAPVVQDTVAKPADGAVADAKGSSAHAAVMPPAEPVVRSPPVARTPPVAPKGPTQPDTAAAPKPSPPPPVFQSDTTQKLAPEIAAAAAMIAGGGESSPGMLQLSDELLSRHQRKMPTGTSLLQLLPHSAGEFERPHATPAGELTSDPVSAMYSVTGHPVAVRLVQCWDEEEARERLKEVKVQAGNNCRMGDDKSWILGTTLQGLVFAWTRGNYSFTATAPKGVISMVRFLNAFPY